MISGMISQFYQNPKSKKRTPLLRLRHFTFEDARLNNALIVFILSVLSFLFSPHLVQEAYLLNSLCF